MSGRRCPISELYRGQEIQYFEGMVEMLREGKLLTLAGSRYVLTEFLADILLEPD